MLYAIFPPSIRLLVIVICLSIRYLRGHRLFSFVVSRLHSAFLELFFSVYIPKFTISKAVMTFISIIQSAFIRSIFNVDLVSNEFLTECARCVDTSKAMSTFHTILFFNFALIRVASHMRHM